MRPNPIGSSGSAAARSASDGGASSAASSSIAHQRVLGRLPRIDERAQRSRALNAAGDVIHRQSRDVRRAADRGCVECPPRARIAARIHREVAFRVHAHRPPREVGRPNPDQLVVDDHHLRVDEGRHVLRARRRRVDEPQPLVRVGGDQLPEDGVAKGAHRGSARASRGIPVGVTTRTSGPSGSRSRAASAAPSVSLVKYWLSM